MKYHTLRAIVGGLEPLSALMTLILALNPFKINELIHQIQYNKVRDGFGSEYNERRNLMVAKLKRNFEFSA